MKTIKLKTNVEDKQLESLVNNILHNQIDVCDWDLDLSSTNKVLTIHVKELLNEEFIISRLNNSGIDTEILQIEKVTADGPIRSSCD